MVSLSREATHTVSSRRRMAREVVVSLTEASRTEARRRRGRSLTVASRMALGRRDRSLMELHKDRDKRTRLAKHQLRILL